MQIQWNPQPRRIYRVRRRGSPVLFLAIFGGVGLILLGLGLFFLSDTWHFLGRATATATGTIVACERSGKGSCQPTVTFTTGRGEEITFSPSFSSTSFEVGQQQPVAYDPNHPQDARIASFLVLWFLPTLFLGMGGLFVLVGGGLFIVGSALGRQRANPVW